MYSSRCQGQSSLSLVGKENDRQWLIKMVLEIKDNTLPWYSLYSTDWWNIAAGDWNPELWCPLKSIVIVASIFNEPLYMSAVVAEWLRRWTRNPLGSARAGSNPADCAHFSYSPVIIGELWDFACTCTCEWNGMGTWEALWIKLCWEISC